MTKKRTALIAIVILLVLTGYLRDYIFVGIHTSMWYSYHHKPLLHPTPFTVYLIGFSYAQLYIAKWFLTALFTVIYFLLSCGVIKLIFIKKAYIRYLMITYGVLLSVAALFYITGLLSGYTEEGYKFSRIFMGFLQSPFMVMVLIPAFYLISNGKVAGKVSE